MSEKQSEQAVWYLKRDRRQVGPLTGTHIRRSLMRGRVNLEDEVSLDRKSWRKVAEVAEVVPPSLRASADDSVSVATRGRRVPWLSIGVFILLVCTALAFALFHGGNFPQPEPACDAPASRGVDWRGCRIMGKDLAGADLREARLQNARLAGTGLAGADLSRANLDYADLSLADLGYANLKQSSLRGADLRGADLRDADLSDADLSFADLSGTTLTGARLQGARFHETIWVDGQTCAAGSIGACSPPRDPGKGN